MGSFTREFTVRLKDTDAAGILYFTNLLVFAHETFEQYLDESGSPLGHQLATADYMLPIVHSEADYLSSMTVSDRITVKMDIERIGTKSFTVAYTMYRDGEEAGRCKIVHASMDRKSRRPIPLPAVVLDQLRDFPGESSS